MPFSDNKFDTYIKSHIKANYIKPRILDIGAWAWKYYDLLWCLSSKIDAVEIRKPYISSYKLKDKYNNVFEQDILDFKLRRWDYDLAIMWDIFEHLTEDEANIVIKKFNWENIWLYVIVPYESEQWEWNGNKYEVHKQPDLTHEVFAQRYTMFELIIKDYNMWLYYMKPSLLHNSLEIESFINKFNQQTSLALTRIGDWELMLIEWKRIKEWTQSYHTDRRSSEWKSLLGRDLKKALKIVHPNYMYWIACECCNLRVQEETLKLLDSTNITYANLFVNWNYEHFKFWLNTLSLTWINLIANKLYNEEKMPFPVKSKFDVPDDCVNRYENNKYKLFDELYKKYKWVTQQTFFISAWPLAKVIIHFLRNEVSMDNKYIDVWSALDEFGYGRKTRKYMNPSEDNAQKDCLLIT